MGSYPPLAKGNPTDSKFPTFLGCSCMRASQTILGVLPSYNGEAPGLVEDFPEQVSLALFGGRGLARRFLRWYQKTVQHTHLYDEEGGFSLYRHAAKMGLNDTPR